LGESCVLAATDILGVEDLKFANDRFGLGASDDRMEVMERCNINALNGALVLIDLLK
jgi:hypothetical protein